MQKAAMITAFSSQLHFIEHKTENVTFMVTLAPLEYTTDHPNYMDQRLKHRDKIRKCMIDQKLTSSQYSHHTQRSSAALCNGHSKISKKMEISIPCKIATPQNFILKFGT